MTRFAVDSGKLELQVIDIRIPQPGDLYINKNNKLQRQKGTRYSKSAQKRVIVKEGWDLEVLNG